MDIQMWEEAARRTPQKLLDELMGLQPEAISAAIIGALVIGGKARRGAVRVLTEDIDVFGVNPIWQQIDSSEPACVMLAEALLPILRADRNSTQRLIPVLKARCNGIKFWEPEGLTYASLDPGSSELLIDFVRFLEENSHRFRLEDSEPFDETAKEEGESDEEDDDPDNPFYGGKKWGEVVASR